MKTALTVDYKGEVLKCGFCFDREQHTHGEVKREWSTEWSLFIPVCRKHTIPDSPIGGVDSSED